MKRGFLVEEIMLEGVSGEVRGTVHIDEQSGLVDQIACESFCFRRDDVDSPTWLNQSQVAQARRIVEKALQADEELMAQQLSSPPSTIVRSAERFSPRPAASASTQVLAGYLQTVRRPIEQQPKQSRHAR